MKYSCTATLLLASGILSQEVIVEPMSAYSSPGIFQPITTKRFSEIQHTFTIPEEAEARRHVIAAAAAYCEDADLQSNTCDKMSYAEGLEYKTSVHDVVHETKASFFVNETGKEIVISFRGSVNLRDWMANLQTDLTPYKGGEKKVHTGFKSCAENMKPKIEEVLTPLIEAHPDFTIVVVAHSLGGAITTLIAPEIKEKYEKSLKVYTYGQPRVGNAKFAKWYNKLNIPTIRVVVLTDPVSHIPTLDMGYNHTEL